MESMCNIGNSYLLSTFQQILFIELYNSILLSYYLIHLYKFILICIIIHN